MESRRRAALAVLALALVAAVAIVPFAFEGSDAVTEIEASDHIKVVGDPDVVGNKITLVADEKYVQGSGNATVLYTFSGWYVDGEKASSDSLWTYTVVSGDHQIAAKYAAADSGTSQAGIDPMVLIIGICAVVVAIAAVVFAVVGKKEKA